jgi:uncharacterized SAM-binding protein YcdF (DUF218 family)
MTDLKQWLEACFSPAGIMTLSFLTGIFILAFRPASRLGRRLVVCGAGLYLAYIFTPAAELLITKLERPYPPVLHPDASAGIRTVVVLSGFGEEIPGIPVTSRLSLETIARLAEGIRLYREIPGAKLVLSGGVVREHDGPIAAMMAEFAGVLGVPARDLLKEGNSTTTYENLVEVKKIIGAQPFYLVTSACDLRRAMAVARKLEMKATAAPAAIWAAQHFPAEASWSEWAGNLAESMLTPSTNRLTYLQWAYHEYMGYLWYRALGRL